MAVNWAGMWRVAQTIFGLAEASRHLMGGARPAAADLEERETRELTRTSAGGGMLGHLEAKLTGVVVSALKEAFDRDAARLDLERAMLEDQRRRAEQALRLELVRQAADRSLSRLRAVGALALVVWVVSVLFLMRFPDGLAGAPRYVLGGGWVALLGAAAASFAAHTRVSRWVAAAHLENAAPEAVPDTGAAASAPWLVLAGLALVGTSLLIAL